VVLAGKSSATAKHLQEECDISKSSTPTHMCAAVACMKQAHDQLPHSQAVMA
jgi:hypothetical protein